MHKSGGKPQILTVAMKANIISEMTGKVYEKTVAEFEKNVPTAHVNQYAATHLTNDFLYTPYELALFAAVFL